MSKITGILTLLVYICVATALLNDAFVSVFNMQNIVERSALFGIIGIGVAFVIMTGGIDLSIGSVIGLIGCILAMLLDEGWSVATALVAVLGLSAVIGLYHGLLITKLRLQPFVVTLCGLLYYRGLIRWITGDQNQGFGSGYDNSLRLLAIGKPCSVAFVMLLCGIAAVLYAAYLLIRSWGKSADKKGIRGVALVAGIVLCLIGASRFVSYGYAIETGPALLSIGSWDVPTWHTIIPDAGVALPGRLMQYAAWGIPPGVLWLGILLVRRQAMLPVVPATIVLAIGLAWIKLASWLLQTPSSEWGQYSDAVWFAAADWLREGKGWAHITKIAFVCSALGTLIWGLFAFARKAAQHAGRPTHAPMALIAVSAILWLIGRTPLGQTLVPAPMLFLVVIGILASIFLNQTIYGRYILALGRNEEAARYSGINTDLMTILAYVLCSLGAGVGGVLFALHTNALQPSGFGNFYELYAIAAAVLGGCSLRGGEGTILGVVIGAAVMQVLRNSITMVGIRSQLEFAIIGGVILIGVLTDEIVRRLAARRAALAEARAIAAGE